MTTVVLQCVSVCVCIHTYECDLFPFRQATFIVPSKPGGGFVVVVVPVLVDNSVEVVFHSQLHSIPSIRMAIVFRIVNKWHCTIFWLTCSHKSSIKDDK